VRAVLLSQSPSIRIVCPLCYGQLKRTAQSLQCETCRSDFTIQDGLADLSIGQRYDDPTPEAILRNEEVTNAATTRRFWIPLFRSLWTRPPQSLRLLSVGCGVGTDVEVLFAAGFDVMGIDCGKRAALWNGRQHPERYVFANAKNLPFEDATFDCLFSGCLFPHVGVEGTTYNVTSDYLQQRLRLAQEMSRVLRPGGKIICCNPNRNFPFDVFHGHEAGKLTLRPTSRQNPLLLSVDDYAHLFGRNGCSRVVTLPIEKYWTFAGSRKTLRGCILCFPVRLWFWLVSRDTFSFLRRSFLNPWLIVMIEKEATG
jgi:SAM-dependent methyltransferase